MGSDVENHTAHAPSVIIGGRAGAGEAQPPSGGPSGD